MSISAKLLQSGMFLTAAISLNAGPMWDKTPVLQPTPAAPPPPLCNTISYDFVQAQYHHLFSEDYPSDGFGIATSKSLTDNLFGFANYNQYFDGTELLSIDAGLGYHVPVTQCIDFVVKAASVYDDSIYGSAFSGSGGLGFRMGLTSWLQVDVFYHGFWYKFEDYSNSGSAAVILREVIAPKLDVVLSGSVGQEDWQTVSAGLRFNF
jgi:hypothetical protein